MEKGQLASHKKCLRIQAAINDIRLLWQRSSVTQGLFEGCQPIEQSTRSDSPVIVSESQILRRVC